MKGKVIPTPHESYTSAHHRCPAALGTKVRMFNNTANVERGNEKRRSRRILQAAPGPASLSLTGRWTWNVERAPRHHELQAKFIIQAFCHKLHGSRAFNSEKFEASMLDPRGQDKCPSTMFLIFNMPVNLPFRNAIILEIVWFKLKPKRFPFHDTMHIRNSINCIRFYAKNMRI